MSTGSISDALSRVSAIQQQLQQLGNGAIFDSALGVSSGGSSPATTSSSSDASPSTDAGSGTDFANALASAEGTDATSDAADSALSPDTDLLTGGVAVDPGSSATAAVALPGQASALLTSNQQQFASTLSADTGLSPSVVSAWLLAEESGTAAQTRQSAGNNDWLNVGYTDSGTYGADDPVWSDPTSAANATAAWLGGQDSISGYGTAGSGVQSILSSVGQSPASQVQAIQSSGWSSSGYPSLSALYASVVDGP